MAKLLIVDDEIGIRELLSEILHDEGHDVLLAENAAAARAVRNATCPDMVLLDIWMPDTDGITLLKEWSAAGQLTMPVVMMSGHGTIDTAVEATRIGAIDYLEKPIALQKLLSAVKRGLQRRPQVVAPMPLTLAAFPESAVLAAFYQQLRQAAAQSRVILLEVGADHLAELAAHSLQGAGTPWLDIGALGGPLDPGLLSNHQGGVLFVAALEGLTRPQQKNLAFVLDRLERYDLRLVAASSLTQDALAASGWDGALLKRLFAIAITAPAFGVLRAELPAIATRILRYLIDTKEVPPREFAAAGLDCFVEHGWDGNYGELYATIRKLALAAGDNRIVFPDISHSSPHAPPEAPPVMHQVSFDMPLREAREAFERMYFDHHLKLESGNMTRLAQKTGLERTHLYRKLKQLGLHGGRRQN
jgi:DNA-binding NtrC family response regulator